MFTSLRWVALGLLSACLNSAIAQPSQALYWIRLSAQTKEERTHIANTGVAIEMIGEDYVIALGGPEQLEELRSEGLVKVAHEHRTTLDFPRSDSQFHDYTRMMAQITQWEQNNKDILRVVTIGHSTEGRALVDIVISTDPDHASTKPGVAFMGGHHGREHLSVEMPLGLVRHLLEEYRSGNAEVVSLIEGREIHVIPMVNPDGLEFDISGGNYHMWRKNRRNNGDGTFGVDLNRNYGHEWAVTGASFRTSSEVYAGPSEFSEPETRAIRDFVSAHSNISILLSFHTFSKLILYPWGYTYDGIAVARDKAVHEKMAQTMAKWNGYTPQQSSDLYAASGDTTDWAYAEHRIISFTFELDPGHMHEGGFYPGQKVIKSVIRKNLKPSLYLIEYADNPYRVLDPGQQFGVNLSWIQ